LKSFLRVAFYFFPSLGTNCHNTIKCLYFSDFPVSTNNKQQANSFKNMKLSSVITLAAGAIFSFANTVLAQGDIVDIAVGNGSFTTLVAAVSAAGLVDTLKSPGPFTVFAPTDDAFAALPAGTIEALLADPTGALTDILLYHVVSGTALSSDLSNRLPVTTVLGEDVCVYIEDGNVFINDAAVIIADIEASNGVIHVIDSVLLPPSSDKSSKSSKSGKCPKSWSYKSAKGAKSAKGTKSPKSPKSRLLRA
jgi:uncharacterized surface protein with fasciclin (FAS1) repeats